MLLHAKSIMDVDCVDVYYGRIGDVYTDGGADKVADRANPGDGLRDGPIWRLLRRILADTIGIEAALLKFDTGPNGKPYILAPTEPALWFNISHTTDRYCIAISSSVPVGVDIERIRTDRDYPAMAEYAFTPQEARAIDGTSRDKTALKFVALWVRKEAIIKSIGGSSARLLDSFSVPTTLTRCRFTVKAATRTIAVQDLPAGTAHRVSVAWEGAENVSINYRRIDSYYED